MRLTLTLNGDPVTLPGDATVADAVAHLGHDPGQPGVAVAVDGDVVRRAEWAGTTLADGQVVEVVTAVQGG